MGVYLARCAAWDMVMAYSPPDLRIRDKLEGGCGWFAVSDLDQQTGSFGRDYAFGGGRLMHISQMAIGGAAVIGFLQLAIINPIKTRLAPLPPPIIVHSLEYADGMITQDRTVSTDGPFVAAWSAQIINAQTGRAVIGCEGSGVWPYPPGRIAPSMSVAEWVGSDACVLGVGKYQPIVTFQAGSWENVTRGEVFEVTE
jgi:hypothetical protein